MKKLPEILFAFWVMKICATTLGETADDLLSMTMNVGYATSTIILMGIFLVTVAAQLLSKRFTRSSTGPSFYPPARRALPCPTTWTARWGWVTRRAVQSCY